MIRDLQNVFEATTAEFERAFTVRLIATFNFTACRSDEDAAVVLHRHPKFDQIPVRDDKQVIGVLERRDGIAGTAAENMRRLEGSILVSAAEPLTTFLPCLAEGRYFLILRGQRIDGIITRSDILKLPVRLLAFTLVAHLETIMNELITSRRPDDAGLPLLHPDRQANALAKQASLRAEGLDPDMVETLDFCDKRTIVRELFGLSDSFERQLYKVERVRNMVAHAANYARTEDRLQKFLRRLELARKWIQKLAAISPEPMAGAPRDEICTRI